MSARDDLVAAMELRKDYEGISYVGPDPCGHGAGAAEIAYAKAQAAAVKFVNKHGPALLALLDAEPVAAEPTLEEVLAELAQYGDVTLVMDDGVWACWLSLLQGGPCKTEAETPLQAASECLRRVKG